MKFFRKIHLWLSVPFGIFITLVCFSGGMLIFEPEITRAIKSDVYYVSSVKDQPLPLGELMETVKASLPDSVSITGVTVFDDNERTYQVSLSKPRRSSMFIDQYSGEITGKYERLGFFSTMFKLHRWLLDSANPHVDGVKVGKTLVGISTIIFVIALITGVIIWVPRARKNLKKSLSISFDKGWKGFWKGLHVAGGMYALIFVLAMALTGLTYSFGWYRTAFYAVCGVEHTPRNFGQGAPAASKNEGGERGEGREGRGGRGEGRGEGGEWKGRGEGGEGREGRGGRGEGRGEGGEWHGRGEGENSGERGEGRGGRGGHRRSEFGRWQQVYDELKAQNPDAPQITISSESASVTLGTTGNGRAADRYEFNRRTGEISPSTLYANSKEADKLRGWIYAIHTGSLGGIVTRILWLLGALLGASLPLTGYYIWIRHLKRKKDGHHDHHKH
ncbi:PepSY-associated TM helix domain-containing protein [uncultured Duncaniella sp.]|uniref:PepSY-associated TM helix domain-containing protein n=1 Tax=uncultured Duncaniella sp. TaxID=2768039 RepID=UPI0026025979|nr:PepSY-associated TM helix domain-containing protein [uncultured Duncaniella sp.]